MKRKILSSIIVSIATIVAAMCFVACGGKGDSGSSGNRPDDEQHTVHSFVDYVYNNDATCVADGTETAKCEFCDETDTRTKAGTATGEHTYTSYTYNNDATCVTDGTETAKCEFCDKTDTRTKAGTATGVHTFTNYVYKYDATCVADGTETARCEYCRATDTRTKAGTATGVHTFTNYVYNNDATCVADGTETARCINCSETDTRTKMHSATGIHSIRGYFCTVCGNYAPDAPISDNLTFSEIREDNDIVGYSVVGIGSATSPVLIPKTHNDKPVTSIGSGAFQNCSNITEIIVPDSVTSIGNYAFYNCNGLQSIEIPNSVTSIESAVFSGCSGLISMTLPFVGANAVATSASGSTLFGYVFGSTRYTGGVETRQSYATGSSSTYYVPSSLRSVTITGGKILRSAFQNCSNLTAINLPNSVTSIGEFAFVGCKNLINFSIPDGVTSIGQDAFQSCGGLQAIAIPFVGATKDGTTNTHIGYLFGTDDYNKNGNFVPNSLKTVVITGGTHIDSNAFYGCGNLEYIGIPNSVTSIGSSAFSGCGSLKSMTIPNGVTSIGSGVFDGCDKLRYNEYNNALYLGNSDNPYHVLIKAKNTEITDCAVNADTKLIYYNAFHDCTGLASVTIGNTVMHIGSNAFRGCSSLTSITIPNSVTSIWDSAFHDCSSLTSVIIGNGVTSVGSLAFYGCVSLTSVTIGNSVTSIGTYAFYRCDKLEYNEYGNALYLGNSDNPYQVLIKAKNTEITDCTVNTDTKLIYHSAFSGCSGLTSITIPNSVTSIGSSAFYGCRSLTSITIPNGVMSIGSGVFSGCSSLISIIVADGNRVYHSVDNCLIDTANKRLIAGCRTSTIPNDGSVTSIGTEAFLGCRNLISIEIPNSVTSISYSAFNGCRSLTSIEIPNSVIFIGQNAFVGCDNLQNAVFANPYGWKASDNDIASKDLSDTSLAARFLTFSAYASYNWERS